MERTTFSTHKIAVFSSGLSRGSNLSAMHSYFTENKLPIEIALVIFTRPDAPAVQLAKDLGLHYQIVSAHNMPSFESKALELCQQNKIELIALAGFMKKLSQTFLEQINIPVMNIHPALLPKYGGAGMYGMAVHNAVFAAQEKESGVTIHLVDPQYDHGNIIAQETITIQDCNSPEEIAAKVLKTEHSTYAKTIYQLLSKR